MFIRLLLKLLRALGWTPYGIPVYIQENADGLVKSVEAFSTTGENKRHKVYAALLKKYPAIEPHVIGLAIELAVFKQRQSF